MPTTLPIEVTGNGFFPSEAGDEVFGGHLRITVQRSPASLVADLVVEESTDNGETWKEYFTISKRLPAAGPRVQYLPMPTPRRLRLAVRNVVGPFQVYWEETR